MVEVGGAKLCTSAYVVELAATKGDADAVENRDIVAARMTTQQIAAAQKLARECQARNYKNCD